LFDPRRLLAVPGLLLFAERQRALGVIMKAARAIEYLQALAYDRRGTADLQTAVNHRQRKSQVQTVPPTSRDLTRFTERCRARDLGYELPLTTREAASYVGFHWKTVERMVRMGEIPAHPASGVHRKTWKFYPSELDVWLREKINSNR
jgi:excisionase family DNA binding protein